MLNVDYEDNHVLSSMSAKLQKFKDNTKLIAMCGNILFVLNEYVNMIVDITLIGDNHLGRVEDFFRDLHIQT